MHICPHCGNKLPPADQGNYSWQRYSPANNKPVSLGCGTLIILAIIVAVFSKSGNNNDSNAFRSLRRDLRSLEKKIEKLDSKLPVGAADDAAVDARQTMIFNRIIKAKLKEIQLEREKESRSTAAEARDESSPRKAEEDNGSNLSP